MTIACFSPRRWVSTGARAHLHDAAPGGVGLTDALEAVDEAGGGEVRPGQRAHQARQLHLRVVDHQAQRVAHLGQVVGRDVGGHADRDAGGAVDEQVGHLGGQHRRLELLAVVVGHPVDGLLADVVLDHLLGELGQAHLGVAHRRRVVAVDRAEVALAVDQAVAHGEVLRHAHERVVDRLVAVRVVAAHDVAHDARRLLVRLRGGIARLPHAVEHAPVHGLEPVAHVGQRAAHDHAHRVVEVRPLHLLFDVDRMRSLEGQHRVLVGHLSGPGSGRAPLRRRGCAR